MKRRLAIGLAAVGTLGGVVFALVTRFFLPFRPRITQVVVSLPRAHQHLSGLCIAYVTDTHVGPAFSAERLQPVMDALRREKPDILLFGGDFISESPRFLDTATSALGKMVSSSRYGAYAVLGNHDISNVRSRVTCALREVDIQVLQNEATCIETHAGDLWIAGVDDAIMGRADVEMTFRQVPCEAACICLWHEPDHAEIAERFGPFLQLSGHTHGGQVRLPMIGPLALPLLGRRYPSGRYQVGNMTLYVSNGIGMYRPPVRLNCPPELVMVRLLA